MTVEDKPDVTYEDVGGAKEALEKLREVVELPLLHPERFVTLGIDPPKGVLLFGPPGTGKTLSARAVANRTDACFIRVIGSELVQKYVGEGARMVRELFTMARTKKACIVFFDEIDAIGKKKGRRLVISQLNSSYVSNRTSLEFLPLCDLISSPVRLALEIRPPFQIFIPRCHRFDAVVSHFPFYVHCRGKPYGRRRQRRGQRGAADYAPDRDGA